MRENSMDLRGSIMPDDWLWCLHCERFFQAKDLRPDDVGGKEACAFENCNGAGLEVAIYVWNDWAKQNGLKHWPKSTTELRKGLKCPLYPQKKDQRTKKGVEGMFDDVPELKGELVAVKGRGRSKGYMLFPENELVFEKRVIRQWKRGEETLEQELRRTKRVRIYFPEYQEAEYQASRNFLK